MPHEGHYNFSKDQQNEDDFQNLGAIGCGLVGDHPIRTLNHFQRSSNTLFPLFEMKALGEQAVAPLVWTAFPGN